MISCYLQTLFSATVPKLCSSPVYPRFFAVPQRKKTKTFLCLISSILLQVPSISVKATPPAAKFTVQPAAVAKHKAGGPTKSVPGTKLAAVNQGTPDSSESSDSEEEQPGAQVQYTDRNYY